MRRNLLLGLLILLVSGSCRTLPKVTTFVEASSQLRKGVKSGFDALLVNDTERKGLREDEKKLRDLFSVMDKSLLGITAYAGALNNLVEAGNSGEKNASQAASALTQIADQVAPEPVRAILGVSTETAGKIYAQIAKVRAARKLETIMVEAAPAVDDIRLVLSKMMEKLIDYNKAVYRSRLNSLMEPNTIAKNSIDYETYLGKEQVKLYEKLALISAYKASEVKDFENLKKQVDLLKDEKDVERRQGELVEQSRRIDGEQQRITPVTDRVRNANRKIMEQYTTIEQVFRTSNNALISWNKAHADIIQQLARKSPPNFQELSEIIDDLKELRSKIKELNP